MADWIDVAAGVLADLDDAVVVLDRGGSIVLWNTAAEHLFATAGDAAVGSDRWLIERQDGAADWLPDVLEGDRQRFRARRGPSGGEVEVEIVAAPVRSSDGKVIGASQVMRPVAEPGDSGVLKGPDTRSPAGSSADLAQVLREALDAMDDALSIYDSDDRFLFANRRYFELYPFLKELNGLQGRTFEEVLRYNISRGSAGGVRDPEGYVQRRLSDRYELRRIPERHMPDGSWHLIKENRSQSGYTITRRLDITRRKESGLALASASVVLQAILDTMPNPLIAFDVGNHLVAWNRAFERLVEMPRGSLKSGRSLVGVAKETIRRVPSTEHGIKRMFRAVASGESVEFEWEREGERLFFVIGRPMADGGYLSMWRDVTSERRAQQLVAETQQRLIEAIETMSEGFALFDRQDRLVLSNTRYREMYGVPDLAVSERWNFEQLIRYGLEHGRFSDALGREDAWIAERMAHHTDPSGGTTEQRLDDGRVLLISETRTRDGGVVGIRADITDRIRAEEALRATRDELADKAESLWRLADEIDEARRRAEDADAAKSRFLAMMSHELRTPMTGLLGMVELLSRTRLDSEQDELLRVMRVSAETLLALLNDILDYSKLEAGKVQLEEIPFRPSQVLEDVIHLFEIAATSKGLTLAGSVDPTLPDHLRGDPLRLKQILSNLVSNAVKFTDQGRVTIGLERGGASDGRIEVLGAVTDTGIGISESAQQNLFAAFEQADKSTSFRFSVMMHPAPGTVAEREADSGDDDQSDAPVYRPGRILLVEDNDVNRMLVSRMLAQDGHRIDEVIDGSQAVAAVQRVAYDLVLMDLQMPVMDGAEATRRIRALGPPYTDLPIIALTADALPEHHAGFI